MLTSPDMIRKSKAKKTIEIETMYGVHDTVLEPDERGFIVTVPALPGVITWGENLSHAKEMVKEAIELCIECLVEEKQTKQSKISKKALAKTAA